MSATTSKNTKQKRPVEVIVFEDPDKPRKDPAKTSKNSAATNKNKSKSGLGIQPPVFDQRMAMYDIRKLAMTGMVQEDKEEAMVNYLVELGAKRPKGKPKPMKEYIEELKKRKLEGEKPEDGLEADKKKQRRGKRDKKDIYIDGQIGRWKRGVQFINPGKKLHKGT